MNLKESREKFGALVVANLNAAISDSEVSMQNLALDTGIGRSSLYYLLSGSSPIKTDQVAVIAKAIDHEPCDFALNLLGIEPVSNSAKDKKPLRDLIKEKLHSCEWLNHKSSSKQLGLSTALCKFMDGRKLKLCEVPALANCLCMTCEELINAII